MPPYKGQKFKPKVFKVFEEVNKVGVPGQPDQFIPGDDELETDVVDDAMELDGDGHQPWDRLEGENSASYQAFCVFRDLGPGRTIGKAAAKNNGSFTYYRVLSAQQGWTRRAESYDDAIERRERIIIERGRLEARRRMIVLAKQLQDKAQEGLATLDPTTMNAKDLTLMADIGAKMERQARGEVDTKRVEVTGAGGGPVEMVSGLSSDDRRELLQRINAEIVRRVGVPELPATYAEGHDVIEGTVVDDE